MPNREGSEVGWRRRPAARAVTAFAVAYGVLQMFFGPVGDRYGKYRVVSVATVACALGSAGAVMAVGLFGITLIVTLAQFLLLDRRVHYGN